VYKYRIRLYKKIKSWSQQFFTFVHIIICDTILKRTDAMKIIFFETHQKEKKQFEHAFPSDELIFLTYPLLQETKIEHPDADAISVFVNSQVTDKVFNKFTRLSLIITRSTGHEHIDKKVINV